MTDSNDQTHEKATNPNSNPNPVVFFDIALGGKKRVI